MKASKIIKINSFLSSLSGKKNKEFSISIDNMHTPCVNLPTEYILPSASKNSIEFEPAFHYLKSIAEFIPEAISGCYILPRINFRSEMSSLYLIKELSINNFSYIYIIRLLFHYLGGAEPEKIITKQTTKNTTSVYTNRIYYYIHIIPVNTIFYQGKHPIGFESKKIKAGFFSIDITEELSLESRIRVDLFDDIDYSNIVKPFKELLKIEDFWQPKSIYEPISIEYLTLSLNFLYPSLPVSIHEFSQFKEILEVIHTGEDRVPTEVVVPYSNWLKKHTASRSSSPSGNMIWKIGIAN